MTAAGTREMYIEQPTKGRGSGLVGGTSRCAEALVENHVVNQRPTCAFVRHPRFDQTSPRCVRGRRVSGVPSPQRVASFEVQRWVFTHSRSPTAHLSARGAYL